MSNVSNVIEFPLNDYYFEQQFKIWEQEEIQQEQQQQINKRNFLQRLIVRLINWLYLFIWFNHRRGKGGKENNSPFP